MLLAEAARYADGNWKRKCHECLRPGLGREPVLEGLEGLQDVPQTPPAVGQIAAVGKPAASLDGRSKRTPSTRNCGAPDQIGVCYSSVGSRHSAVTPTGLSLVSTEEALLVIFRTAVIGLVACIIISGASPAVGNDERSGVHWLRKCTNPEPSLQMECAIYVRALVEYDEVRAKMLGQKRFICPHNDLTVGQSREVVLKFLREKPESLQQPFVLLAHLALQAAYPCTGER